MQRIGMAVAAVCGVILGFAISSAPARAEVCGDLYDECHIADQVLGWNLDQFEQFDPMDEATCMTATLSVLKQCESAVKGAAKCWASQINAIPKNAKAACKTEGDLAKQCNADFKEEATEDVDELDEFVELELDCCEDRSHAFFVSCVIHN